MALNKGLGKGIDALFVTNLDRSLVEADKNRIRVIAVAQISPNEQQPRSTFDDSALNELAASIKRHGVLQPLIVTKHTQGYQIVAGERRWRAAQKAGLKDVPVIVRSFEELEKLEVALIENVQRVDLSPLEQAASIYKLHTQFSIDYNDIATRLGKASTTVSNIVRLLQLPEAAAKALSSGAITEGHARSILALTGKPELQAALLSKIKTQGWTVRQAEAFAASGKMGKTAKTVTNKASAETDEKLTSHLKMPVSIKRQKRGGQVVIRFNSQTELETLTKKLLS